MNTLVAISNIELVRSTAVPIENLTSEIEHIVRVQKVIGKKFLAGFTPEKFNALNSKGIRLVVKTSDVVKFKYHALLWADTKASGGTIRETQYGHIQYIGDLPNFALDRIEVARQNGLVFGTIHSNFPLPTEFISAKKTDPVVIGWCEFPDICINRDIVTSFREILGVVIAMWDMDKELEYLTGGASGK